MKRTMTIVAVGLIILGVLLGGVVALAIWGDWSFNFAGTRQNATLAGRQVFSSGEVNRLEIAYRSDSVTFERGNSGEIVLEEYMSHPADNKLARTSQSGNTLRIEQGDRTGQWFGLVNYSYAILYLPADWDGIFDAECTSGSLKTEYDWQFAAASIRANSGSIRFAGLTVDGDLTMTASSGSVRADILDVGGSCVVKATSGSVSIGSASATRLDAENSSGSIKFDSAVAETIAMRCNSGTIKVEHIEGAFDLSTTSGSINLSGGAGQGRATAASGAVKVALSSISGDIYLETSSGSVKLDMPQGQSFTFAANTNSGSIKTDFQNQLAFNEKGNSASGTVGEDPAFHIECKASSGSIRVEY